MILTEKMKSEIYEESNFGLNVFSSITTWWIQTIFEPDLPN